MFLLKKQKFVQGSVCPCCGTLFHTRVRVLQHLSRASCACRVMLEGGTVPKLDEATVAAAFVQERAERRAARTAGRHELSGLPCVRVQECVFVEGEFS